mgnify:CR=1 FL=1|tara:strand:- start:84 stop:767 length:684 start_codon:yes stop_codon:yes gene_type:complete
MKTNNVLNCLLLILLTLPLFGQQDNTGNWLMYFGTNKIHDQFSIHSEIQYRNHTVSPTNVEQLLLRTGLNYHFSDNAFVTAGYAYVPSYVFESEQRKPETTEHRIWQQFISVQRIGRVKMEHRYRIEQRWINQEYKNRLRYRMMLFVPINKPIIEKGSLFLGIYDEIFVHTKTSFFDRNRLYGALGYQFDKNTSLQVGMLHQQLSDYGKWHVQFALFFNTDFTKKSN